MALMKLLNGSEVPLTADEEARYKAEAAQILADAPKVAAQAEINRLEALETPRRLAEAVLSDEGKAWLTANRDKIATERGKL